MRLDHERMSSLESEFQKSDGGLKLPNFVWLLKCAIKHQKTEEMELINGIIKLFNDIDINGDKKIEWHEFTQYIIDAVITRKDKLKTKEVAATDQEKDPNHAQRVKIELAYSKGVKEYSVKQDVGHKLHFSNGIERIFFSKKLKKLIAKDIQSEKLKLINMNLTIDLNLSIPKKYRPESNKLSTLDASEVFIIDFEISEAEELVKYYLIKRFAHFCRTKSSYFGNMRSLIKYFLL
jgi:hypothetical protein